MEFGMSIAAGNDVWTMATYFSTVQEGKDPLKTPDARDIKFTKIEALKQAAEKNAPIDHAARDLLIQLIAHKDEEVREKARASVLELYKQFPTDVGDRLVTLLKIAQDNDGYMTQDAKRFISYHVAKHEKNFRHNGDVYQQALATWDAALKTVPDKALLWSLHDNSQLVERHFSNASLEEAAVLDAAANASSEYKTNVVREGLSGDALLDNNRYIPLSELESYAHHLKRKQTPADTPIDVRYHGVPASGNVADLKNLIAANNGEVAIGTVLVCGHYVHIVRRDTDQGKEICILDTLGSVEKMRKESRNKFAELKNDLTNQGFTFSEVNVNLQHDDQDHESGLPNAGGVGLPNACGIFGIALQDWLQENPNVPKGPLEDLVAEFVKHVREMPQERRQSMNDMIRFRLLNAAANCQSSDI